MNSYAYSRELLDWIALVNGALDDFDMDFNVPLLLGFDANARFGNVPSAVFGEHQADVENGLWR